MRIIICGRNFRPQIYLPKVRYLKKEMVELHKISDPKKQSEKMQRFGEVISDIVMPVTALKDWVVIFYKNKFATEGDFY